MSLKEASRLDRQCLPLHWKQIGEADLAFDYGPMGIRINNVGPGATRTKALASVLTPEIEARMLAHTPIHRLGEVTDIAGAVLYFAAPVSEWVSGQTLMVNGGGVQTLD